MATRAATADVLRAWLGDRVASDLCAETPALWPHQVRDFRVADVLAALWLEATPRAAEALQELLPDLMVPVPLEPPDRPRLTPRPARRIHLVTTSNPHPEGTPMHRNWRCYREGASLRDYASLGGNPLILQGDRRRGFVRVA